MARQIEIDFSAPSLADMQAQPFDDLVTEAMESSDRVIHQKQPKNEVKSDLSLVGKIKGHFSVYKQNRGKGHN